MVVRCWRRSVHSRIKAEVRAICTSLPLSAVQVKGKADSESYDTGIKCYDSRRKAVVPLTTRRPGVVTWYACGPTVYDSAHIGHASSYVKQDLIRRVLTKFFDIDCVSLLGITDVDDKIIRRSNEVGIEFTTLARKYEAEFLSDMRRLGVLPPTAVARVSDHIMSIVNFVESLLEKRLAYRASSGSVYFDTAEYQRQGYMYGKFVPISQMEDSGEPGSASSATGKKKKEDFALWKAAKPGEPFWPSPFSNGRPGWHIECSAMASQAFGDAVDIHSGGMDLMFPHHENEEAQSCAFHGGHQWVGHWIHSGQLNIKGEKMSKSLKNFISVSEILEKYTPTQFRMMCMLSHYRSRIDFSGETMSLACNVLEKFTRFRRDCGVILARGRKLGSVTSIADLEQVFSSTKQKVPQYLSDDFKVPAVVGCLSELMNETNKVIGTTGNLVDEMGRKQRQLTSPTAAETVGLIAEYTSKVMGDLGLELAASEVASSSTQTIDISLLLDSVLAFRSSVRDFALAKDGSSSATMTKGAKKELIEQRKPLLTACDKLRQDLNASGVAIKDNDGKAQWEIHNREAVKVTAKIPE